MTAGSLVLSAAKDALLDEIGEVTVAPAAARHIKVVTPRPERSEGPQMAATENGDRPSAQPSPDPERREAPQTPPCTPRPEGSVGPQIPPVQHRFEGFDRPPYLAAFHLVGTPLSVQLVNVHLFFGSPSSLS